MLRITDNIFIKLALNKTTGFIGHIYYEASKRFAFEKIKLATLHRKVNWNGKKRNLQNCTSNKHYGKYMYSSSSTKVHLKKKKVNDEIYKLNSNFYR